MKGALGLAAGHDGVPLQHADLVLAGAAFDVVADGGEGGREGGLLECVGTVGNWHFLAAVTRSSIIVSQL